MALIAAYISGVNKESFDLRIFENRAGAKLKAAP